MDHRQESILSMFHTSMARPAHGADPRSGLHGLKCQELKALIDREGLAVRKDTGGHNRRTKVQMVQETIAFVLVFFTFRLPFLFGMASILAFCPFVHLFCV